MHAHCDLLWTLAVTVFSSACTPSKPRVLRPDRGQQQRLLRNVSRVRSRCRAFLTDGDDTSKDAHIGGARCTSAQARRITKFGWAWATTRAGGGRAIQSAWIVAQRRRSTFNALSRRAATTPSTGDDVLVPYGPTLLHSCARRSAWRRTDRQKNVACRRARSPGRTTAQAERYSY